MLQKRLEQAATQRGKRDRPAFDSHRKAGRICPN